MKNIETNPIIIHSWSRTHCGNNNFLIVEESIIYKFNHKTAIRLRPNSIKEDLKDYEMLDLKTSKPLSFDYLEKDVFGKDNVATKDYKYFLIKFVNNVEIICTSYKEFTEILNS